MAPKDLKDRLKALRTDPEIDLTQDALAALSKVLKRVTIAKIEGGHNRGSSQLVRRALAVAFGAPIDDMDAYLDGRMSLAEIKRSIANAKSANPAVTRYKDLPGWPKAEAIVRANPPPKIKGYELMGARMMVVTRKPNREPVDVTWVIAMAAVFRGSCTQAEREAAEALEAAEQQAVLFHTVAKRIHK